MAKVRNEGGISTNPVANRKYAAGAQKRVIRNVRAAARASVKAGNTRAALPKPPAKTTVGNLGRGRATGRPTAPGQVKKGGGFDPGAFAREVSANFGRGVAEVTRGVALPDIGGLAARSRGIPGQSQSAANNAALRKSVGRK